MKPRARERNAAMKPRYVAISIVLIVSLLSSATAQDTPVKVLLLDSYSQYLPWTASFLEGLNRPAEGYTRPIQYFVEYMDSSRLGNAVSDGDWLDYLGKKYASVRFDIVLAESNYSSRFLSANSSYFGQETALVYYSTVPLPCEAPNELQLSMDLAASVEKTARMAVAQNPKRNELVLVTGYKYDDGPIQSALSIVAQANPGVTVSTIKTESIGQMLGAVRALPPQSILFVSLVMWDGEGKSHIPKDVFARIVENSPVPVYSFWSTLLGTGFVGGNLVDSGTIASEMLRAGMDYLSNRAFKESYRTATTFVDWSTLRAFDINPRAVPPEAVVLNRPLPFWKAYSLQLLGLAAAIALLLFAVSFLWSRALKRINARLVNLNVDVSLAKEAAEREARTDTLTGLNNRLAFFEKGMQICGEIKRLNEPVSLLMLDIDDFKRINDTYGHGAGDRVIATIAGIITAAKREVDIAVRFGGEEFVVVAPFTDAAGGELLAERIRGKVENAEIGYGGQTITFTVSIGVYAGNPSTCELNQGLKYADDAMYRAKALGKNRVCLYGAP